MENGLAKFTIPKLSQKSKPASNGVSKNNQNASGPATIAKATGSSKITNLKTKPNHQASSSSVPASLPAKLKTVAGTRKSDSIQFSTTANLHPLTVSSTAKSEKSVWDTVDKLSRSTTASTNTTVPSSKSTPNASTGSARSLSSASVPKPAATAVKPTTTIKPSNSLQRPLSSASAGNASKSGSLQPAANLPSKSQTGAPAVVGPKQSGVNRPSLTNGQPKKPDSAVLNHAKPPVNTTKTADAAKVRSANELKTSLTQKKQPITSSAKTTDKVVQKLPDRATVSTSRNPDIDAKRSRVEDKSKVPTKTGFTSDKSKQKPVNNGLSYDELMKLAEQNAQKNAKRDDYAEMLLTEARKRDEADREYAERKKARLTGKATKPKAADAVEQRASVVPNVVIPTQNIAEADQPVIKPKVAPKVAAPSNYVASLFKIRQPQSSSSSTPVAVTPSDSRKASGVTNGNRVTKLVCDDSLNVGARAVVDDDDYDDYDDDEDSFIDDSAEAEELSPDNEVRRELAAVLKNKFRYDPERFKNEPVGDLRWMESSYNQISREERASARAGAREDEEELRIDQQRKIAKRKGDPLFGPAKRAK